MKRPSQDGFSLAVAGALAAGGFAEGLKKTAHIARFFLFAAASMVVRGFVTTPSILRGAFVRIATGIATEGCDSASDAFAHANVLGDPASLATKCYPTCTLGDRACSTEVGAFAEAIRVISRPGQDGAARSGR